MKPDYYDYISIRNIKERDQRIVDSEIPYKWQIYKAEAELYLTTFYCKCREQIPLHAFEKTRKYRMLKAFHMYFPFQLHKDQLGLLNSSKI